MRLKRKIFGIFGVILFSLSALSGCSRSEIKAESAEFTTEFAVYETDDEKALSPQPETNEEERLEWDLIPMVRVNDVLYYSTNDISTFSYNFADGQIESTVDSSETPVQNDQSNFGEGFDYRYGSNKGELYVNINGTWELFKSRRLTLERILTLSKNQTLTWSDFDGYEYIDTGSGLMIREYDIDPEFCLIIGGTGKGNPMYIRLVSTANQESYIDIGTENVQTEEIEQFIQKNKQLKTEKLVGITAHIKELYGNSMLISSDSDDFPGAFLVDELDQVIETEKLKGGDSIQILMQDANRMDNRNHTALYHAKRIIVLEDDRNEGQEDILLTSVPEFSLTDMLSSQYSKFSISSGNYTFTAKENGEEKTITACGAAPLESLKQLPVLTLPNYNTKTILYSYSTKIPPDTLIIRQWDYANIDGTDTKEESITTFYYPNSLLELERGKVYEFTVKWKKESIQKNKFYADASYVLMTE